MVPAECRFNWDQTPYALCVMVGICSSSSGSTRIRKGSSWQKGSPSTWSRTRGALSKVVCSWEISRRWVRVFRRVAASAALGVGFVERRWTDDALDVTTSSPSPPRSRPVGSNLRRNRAHGSRPHHTAAWSFSIASSFSMVCDRCWAMRRMTAPESRSMQAS